MTYRHTRALHFGRLLTKNQRCVLHQGLQPCDDFEISPLRGLHWQPRALRSIGQHHAVIEVVCKFLAACLASTHEQ